MIVARHFVPGYYRLVSLRDTAFYQLASAIKLMLCALDAFNLINFARQLELAM
jgi:hypothetical protein